MSEGPLESLRKLGVIINSAPQHIRDRDPHDPHALWLYIAEVLESTSSTGEPLYKYAQRRIVELTLKRLNG